MKIELEMTQNGGRLAKLMPCMGWEIPERQYHQIGPARPTKAKQADANEVSFGKKR